MIRSSLTTCLTRRSLNLILMGIVVSLTICLILQQQRCDLQTIDGQTIMAVGSLQGTLGHSNLARKGESSLDQSRVAVVRGEGAEKDKERAAGLAHQSGNVQDLNQLAQVHDGEKWRNIHESGPVQQVTTVATTESSARTLTTEQLVKNVTKIKGKWFAPIPEEEYLQANQSYFQRPKLAIKNNLQHNFLIKGENICGEEAPFLLIIIPSVASHVDMRRAIRETWLKAAETNHWPHVAVRGTVKHVFLFGYHSDAMVSDMELLQREAELHGDVVMANFQDSYRNLTRKILVGFQWQLRYCRQAQIFLKVDEDTLINVPLMLELLHQVFARTGSQTFVLGLKHVYGKPEVVRIGRWAVSNEEYPLQFYPHYLYGHTYAISQQAVRELERLSHYVELIAPEDAYLTGILPKTAGIARLTAPSFTVCCREIYDCEVVWNHRVAITSLSTISLLYQLWVNIVFHSCNSKRSFIPWKNRKKQLARP